MPKRWSKLQREIYNLMDENINIQIHCSICRMKSQFGGTDLPRYWITLGKEVIFDYPKQFVDVKTSKIIGEHPEKYTVAYAYPYATDISDISELIREYIDTPLDALLNKNFNDEWKITDILKAADRRLGKTKLAEHFAKSGNDMVSKVLRARNIFKNDLG